MVGAWMITYIDNFRKPSANEFAFGILCIFDEKCEKNCAVVYSSEHDGILCESCENHVKKFAGNTLVESMYGNTTNIINLSLLLKNVSFLCDSSDNSSTSNAAAGSSVYSRCWTEMYFGRMFMSECSVRVPIVLRNI